MMLCGRASRGHRGIFAVMATVSIVASSITTASVISAATACGRVAIVVPRGIGLAGTADGAPRPEADSGPCHRPQYLHLARRGIRGNLHRPGTGSQHRTGADLARLALLAVARPVRRPRGTRVPDPGPGGRRLASTRLRQSGGDTNSRKPLPNIYDYIRRLSRDRFWYL